MKKFLPKTSFNPSGFTLIELLIVITIIGVLAAIGFAVYANLGAQAKARNIKRKGDLDAISKALEVNKGTTNYVVLAATQFSNGVIPALDPQGNEYCANDAASPAAGAPANPAAAWTTGAVGCAAANPAGSWAPVSATRPPTGTSWKICTWLEAEVNPVVAAGVFCKVSAQ